MKRPIERTTGTRMRIRCLALVWLSLMGAALVHAGEEPGFVDIGHADPHHTSCRSAMPGSDNFIGQPIDGYDAARCLLSAPAAQALLALQQELREFGLSLIVYDCFRPQRAVNDFMRWTHAATDQRMKPRYYPNVDKRRLVREGYIAERSGHSRGSTIWGLATHRERRSRWARHPIARPCRTYVRHNDCRTGAPQPAAAARADGKTRLSQSGVGMVALHPGR